MLSRKCNEGGSMQETWGIGPPREALERLYIIRFSCCNTAFMDAFKWKFAFSDAIRTRAGEGEGLKNYSGDELK